jgi:hypothetical protein
MMPSAEETMLAAVEEKMTLRLKTPIRQQGSRHTPRSKKDQKPAIDHPPNPQRDLVVGAADAACWAMQRTLVDMLVEKGLMTERALCDEVRAIYIAQREMLGKEGAAHMRAWMQQLGCTDIPQ